MSNHLKVLILEDNSEDAELVRDIIMQSGMHCQFSVVMNRDAFSEALSSFSPDVILSDNSLPQFNSEEALQLTRKLLPYVPFILVTGTVSEEYAVKITKSGADDYILKDRLTRLPAAISAALQYRKAEIHVNESIHKLVDSEEKYRKLVDRITDAFISLDANWRFTFANKHACKLFKQDEAFLIGKTIWDVLPGQNGTATYHAYHKAMKDQVYLQVEDYYSLFDYWFEQHIYPSSGGLSVFLRDVTLAREAAEKIKKVAEEKELLGLRMSAILNTIPANIALLNPSGIIIEVNDAWRKFADQNAMTDPDYGIGSNYVKISMTSLGEDKKDGVKVANGIQAVLENRRSSFVFEYPCHSQNLHRWFRMIVTPLSEKVYSGAVVMHIDITELKNMEEERVNHKAAEQKNITRAIIHAQEKERNVMGRELHDNVNQILAGTKLILSTAQIYPGRKPDIIASAIENLQKAIEENRKIAHELVAPDFKDIKIVDQMMSLTESMLKRAGITVNTEANEFNEALLDDEQKLTIYRVAQEQCTNILKYAFARSVQIMLATDKQYFRMKIADDGVGMGKEQSLKGIGFRNMKSRLELFGGTLQTDTSAEKGFRLEITMPLKFNKGA